MLGGIVLQPGCKDPDEIGLGVIPASDTLGVSASDTSTVWTRTVLEDTLRSDELSLQLLGSMNDDVFGKHTASIYTHAVLAGVPNFGGIRQADSLVLSLSYAGYYGDTTTLQNVVVVAGDSVSPQMRIPLSLALADSIMALEGQSQLSTSDNFNAYFKGLYIRTDQAASPGSGSISYFNFSNSKLTLYYHNADTVVKSYSFSLAGARVNSFSHDYTGTVVATQIADSNAVDSLAFLQSMAGVKTKITLPFLKHFADSGSIVVNKAQLVLTSQAGTPIKFGVPSKLLLVAIDSVGGSYFPIDYYETGGYFGGNINSDGRTYTFNLARQIQRILDGRLRNDGFYLVVSGSSVQANRLVIGSGKNASYRATLKLYYTHLP
ncbi:MAG: DUF4270 domain-containing protein [Bacteroidetes bacterium]|nr:DUF4270 domain-containing protein [Bacteroidota bacterium]